MQRSYFYDFLRRRKRFIPQEPPPLDPFVIEYYDNLELSMIFEQVDFHYAYDIADDHPEEADEPETKTKNASLFSQAVFSLPGQQAYQDVSRLIAQDNRFKDCCTVLSFIYHNLSPSLSISSLGQNNS
jgi:hypothetical protein